MLDFFEGDVCQTTNQKQEKITVSSVKDVLEVKTNNQALKIQKSHAFTEGCTLDAITGDSPKEIYRIQKQAQRRQQALLFMKTKKVSKTYTKYKTLYNNHFITNVQLLIKVYNFLYFKDLLSFFNDNTGWLQNLEFFNHCFFFKYTRIFDLKEFPTCIYSLFSFLIKRYKKIFSFLILVLDHSLKK